MLGDRATLEACERELRVAGDRSQEIVEVVSDAAGELADSFELLRLAKLLLELALLGDVAQHDCRPDELAFDNQRCRRTVGHVRHAVAKPRDLRLEAMLLAVLERGRERTAHSGAGAAAGIAVSDRTVHVQPDEPIRCTAGEVPGSGVREGDAALQIETEDSFADGSEEELVLAQEAGQPLLGLLPLRDIQEIALEVDRRIAFPRGDGLVLDPHRPSVGSEHPVLGSERASLGHAGPPFGWNSVAVGGMQSLGPELILVDRLVDRAAEDGLDLGADETDVVVGSEDVRRERKLLDEEAVPHLGETQLLLALPVLDQDRNAEGSLDEHQRCGTGYCEEWIDVPERDEDRPLRCEHDVDRQRLATE